MLLTPQSVELLAPAGSWDVLETVLAAGANAVYLGGKRFNMRLHRSSMNFDDEKLAQSVAYAHARNARLYITVNNLISDREIDDLRQYLTLLEQICPDALIVQDLAVLELAREMKLTVPLHASVMMNIHNEQAVRTLQQYGITRIVAGREMSLAQLQLLKEQTGIELEYFIHGDMCASHSGQCVHSGVLFGQSSNRGRCLKPCRWPYELVDAATGSPVAQNDPGPYKLAAKDMCMYHHLPQLIQSGVCSFKIEGRMRTADFASRIVRIYRKAIDRYIADPAGYAFDPKDWQELYENRSRDFFSCFAFGNPGPKAMGYSGEREPRFFSQAVKEAGLDVPVAVHLPARATAPVTRPTLAVRVSDTASARMACRHGADIVYIGGEAFRPAAPWTLQDIRETLLTAGEYHAQVVVTTPRVTMERECGELEQLFTSLETLQPQGLMVSNIGSLRLAKQTCHIPVQTDFSLNVFNHITARWLQKQGAVKCTVSTEATFEQIQQMLAQSLLPLEMIVHGGLEAMLLEYCLPSYLLDSPAPAGFCRDICSTAAYALADSAGQCHPLMIDQYCRSHLLFAKDLCLLPQLPALYGAGLRHFRIEGQYYQPQHVGAVTAIYRQQLDQLATSPGHTVDPAVIAELAAGSPRELGIGAFRHRISR